MEKLLRTARGEIRYTLERKRVKNINLRVRGGRVFVSAPRFVPLFMVESFVASRADMILRAIEKAPPRESVDGYSDGASFYYLGRELHLRLERGGRASVSASGGELKVTLRSDAGESGLRRAVENWYRAESERLCLKAVDELWPDFARLGARRPTVKMRSMRSSWGNCRKREAVVTFNSRLAALPYECIEYVAAHELSHLLHADHSRDFYGLLGSVMPDHRRRRALIGKYAPLVLG